MNTEVSSNKLSGYDIIGDIHGHADELKSLLVDELGYAHDGQCYRHSSRQAIFLGDFIDRGLQQRDVVQIVMPMVKLGAAQSVIANHEFNALAYHTVDPDNPGAWLRPRNDKNTQQHLAFLNDYLGKKRERELEEVLDWFKTLPLWLDLDGIRIVHACWDPKSMQVLNGQLGPNNTLTDTLLIKACQKGTDEYTAIEVLLKGWEAKIDNDGSFLDKDGNPRHEVRTKWWLIETTSLRDAALAPADIIDRLHEDQFIDGTQFLGYDNEKMLCLGHYWREGEIEIFTPLIACLDYSVAKGDKLVAYRWDGEKEFQIDKFKWVKAVKES
jgi:hypothetical protein